MEYFESIKKQNERAEAAMRAVRDDTEKQTQEFLDSQNRLVQEMFQRRHGYVA